MIKFTSNGDFDFGIESVSIITDSKSLTKRASAKDLLKYEKNPKQTDLHLVAVGSSEGYSCNRNGDAFSEADCKKNHQYFKKADRAVHRHHKNKPADPKYGNIKAAAYNEPMRRVELVVGLDNDKCADILDEQEKRGHTNWSMASKQAYDVCSWCGHKAKSDMDRCEHIPSQIGELSKQGEVCCMLNPDPKWFEISYVARPADRIGMSLSKLSSDSSIKPMLPSDFLQIYTGFQEPTDGFVLSKKAAAKRELLEKLAEMEKHVEAISKGKPVTAKDSYLKHEASKLKHGDKLSDATIDELRKFDPSKLLRVLADHGIIFRPDEFTKYLFGDRVSPERSAGMKTHLPSVFRKVHEDAGDTVNNEHFEPSGMDVLPKGIREMVQRLMGDHSLMGGPAHHRVMRITIIKKVPRGDISEPKEQTKEAFDRELAKQYAAYKLAALNYLDEQGKLDDDLLWNSVLQNWE